MALVDKENPVWLLIGNPNSGKTTLFNALTKQNERAFNYPGSTNVIKEGSFFSLHGEKYILLDAPGTYTLTGKTENDSLIRDLLLGRNEKFPIISGVICVVDSSNLQRNLYLVSQVLEFNIPTIIVLSMVDVAKQRGIKPSENKLKHLLKCNVVSYYRQCCASLFAIKASIHVSKKINDRKHIIFDSKIEEAIQFLPLKSRGTSLTLLFTEATLAKEVVNQLNLNLKNWKTSIIQSRYNYLDQLKIAFYQKETRSEIIDKILLHPLLGLFPLLGFLSLLVWSIFVMAPIPMGWIHLTFSKLALFVHNNISTPWVSNLLSGGIIPGVGNVIAYLPQILLLFFFIGFSESIGYLPRVSFLIDRIMRQFGLHSRAFIPILSSYACSIPGILASRSLSSKHEHLSTIFMIPCISCSGRLPIYMLLIGTIVPKYPLVKSFLLILIYFGTTICAGCIAMFLRRTIFKGPENDSIMELPSFRTPSFPHIFEDLWIQAKSFLWRAGTVILFSSMILWFLMNFPQNEPTKHTENNYATKIGHVLEPVLHPLGYDWKIGVAILSSFSARENFITTLAVIQSREDALNCCWAPEKTSLSLEKYPIKTCVGLLLFFAFSFQCVGTIIVVLKETGSYRYVLYQFIFMNGIASLSALLVNQFGLFLEFW